MSDRLKIVYLLIVLACLARSEIQVDWRRFFAIALLACIDEKKTNRTGRTKYCHRKRKITYTDIYIYAYAAWPTS